MVVMPQGRDQKDNGVRVVSRGAGVMVGRRASSARVAAAVRRVLDDDGLRRSAEQLGAVVRRDANSSALVEALEDLPRQAGASVS